MLLAVITILSNNFKGDERRAELKALNITVQLYFCRDVKEERHSQEF